MSTTRMMILGLVRWLEPVHGYQVRRELVSWGVEDWANLAPGSIYHALRKLTDEGLLEEVGTEQVGARPARTTYRTTRFGREEFGRLVRKFWWEYRTPVDPFLAAFSFLPALPRREAVLALRNRASLLRGQAAMGQEATAGWVTDKPPHVGWMFDLVNARCEAEIEWCERTAARIERGEGVHEGDDSAEAMERWRAEMGVASPPAPPSSPEGD